MTEPKKNKLKKLSFPGIALFFILLGLGLFLWTINFLRQSTDSSLLIDEQAIDAKFITLDSESVAILETAIKLEVASSSSSLDSDSDNASN